MADLTFTPVPLADPSNPYSGVKPRTKFAVGQLVDVRTHISTQVRTDAGNFEYVPSGRHAFAKIVEVNAACLNVELICKRAELITDSAHAERVERWVANGDAYYYSGYAHPATSSRFTTGHSRAGERMWVAKSQATLIHPEHPYLMQYIKRATEAQLRKNARVKLYARMKTWNVPDHRSVAMGYGEGNRLDRSYFLRSRNSVSLGNKKVGEVISKTIATMRVLHDTGASVQEKIDLYMANRRSLHHPYGGFGSGLFDKHVRLLDESGNAVAFNTAGCGHAVIGDLVRVYYSAYEEYNTYCPDCVAAMLDDIVEVRVNDRTVAANRRQCNVYFWEETQEYSFNRPPPVVGGYHSSRTIHTRRFDTSKRPSVGFELEFSQHRNCTKNESTLATEIKARANEAAKGLILPNVPYCTFEYDSSVWFEMVSGYGDVNVHRHVIQQVFAGDPFKGQLQSHDGGKCGFHVHIQKPDSLRHALKLTKFYNDLGNEHLIRSLARRYGDDLQYCKVLKNHAADVEAEAVKHWQNQVYNATPNEKVAYRKDYLKKAIKSINVDRYVMVNFQPANTVEIRVFRGSLVPQTLLACLEFAYLSYTFTRDTPADMLTTKQFLEYIGEPEQRAESRYLRSYLKAKGFDVWMPNPKPEVLPMRRAA